MLLLLHLAGGSSLPDSACTPWSDMQSHSSLSTSPLVGLQCVWHSEHSGVHNVALLHHVC